MKLNFKVKQVRPNIFLFEFTDQYEMCMTFLRYQECYESPNPKFRNKDFTIIDFMDWYRKGHNGVFTYPTDWGGFNIPSEIVLKVSEFLSANDKYYNGGMNIYSDKNKYDDAMMEGYFKCLDLLGEHNRERFYIIGALKGNDKTLQHEVAHGFFYTVPEYKKKMTQLVKKLPKAYYKNACKALKNLGYTKEVFIDECQAYLATGAADTYFGNSTNKYTANFIKVFESYYK